MSFQEVKCILNVFYFLHFINLNLKRLFYTYFFQPNHTIPPETDGPSEPPAAQPLKRSFSLLGSPSEGCTLPLHHMVSLVSMTSPRSFRPHRLSSSPAFVEFDMTESGYG